MIINTTKEDKQGEDKKLEWLIWALPLTTKMFDNNDNGDKSNNHIINDNK